MTKVFVGGSRNITKLDSQVSARLDNIINSNLTVLIGDASGADKSVQKYLAGKNYGNVVVFCMSGRCRNNVGSWETRVVIPENGERGFEFYALKDLQMAEEATHGMMLWDGESNGTLNNIVNLLTRDKKMVVFFAPEKEFYTLRRADDLAGLLKKCKPDDLAGFGKKLALAERLGLTLPDFQLA